jgi:cell division protein FtsW
MDFFSRIFRGDKVIWGIFISLCVISLLAVFSATSTLTYKHMNHWGPILRHAFFLMVGIFCVIFIQRTPTRFFSVLILVLGASILLLIVALAFGEDVNGAQRWIGIGGFTIQPSEFAKISLIGTIAFLLSKQKEENQNTLFYWMIGVIAFTCGLIVTENLSTAVLVFSVCFIMMFIGQVQIRKLLMICVVGVAAVVLLLATIKIIPEKSLPDRFATWKARIDRFSTGKESDSFNNPKYVMVDGKRVQYEITDENFQVSHAKIAIANGYKIIGLPGSGVERDFLPQAYSDFIFAIIIEEIGFVGGLVVLVLYFFLLIRGGILASKCPKLFPKYLILGLTTMLVIQALMNMAVAVNLIPVTGQPLPLISRGGTSTIITCIYFGMILSCSNLKDEMPDTTVDEDIANVAYE